MLCSVSRGSINYLLHWYQAQLHDRTMQAPQVATVGCCFYFLQLFCLACYFDNSDLRFQVSVYSKLLIPLNCLLCQQFEVCSGCKYYSFNQAVSTHCCFFNDYFTGCYLQELFVVLLNQISALTTMNSSDYTDCDFSDRELQWWMIISFTKFNMQLSMYYLLVVCCCYREHWCYQQL